MNVFNRKIYDKLLHWKQNLSKETALLLVGARRIGKTTIVQEFAKKEYKSYIFIDFNDVPKLIIEAFENNLENLDTFYSILSIASGVKLYNRESLIVFDEVQMYPKARQTIKKFVKDGRYDFIETGSLISIKENVQNITIPSEELTIEMFPLDFEEFLWAIGEEKILSYIRDKYDQLEPLSSEMHKKAIDLFTKYILVGGMPQAVVAYIEEQGSFEKCDLIKRMILDLYRKDIMKIKGAYRRKVLSIFDQIPGFLSKGEKRVVRGINTVKTYDDTFMWLSESMICNNAFRCNDPNVGFALTVDTSEMPSVKCYMGDTGLLFSEAFDDNEIHKNNLYEKFLSGNLSINKGMIYENAIAQMLRVRGHHLYFYTHYDNANRRNDIEIDFLLSSSKSINAKIIPIEVKSSNRYKTQSLDKFNEKFSGRIDKSYIIHPKNLEIKNDIIALPCYMTCFL